MLIHTNHRERNRAMEAPTFKIFATDADGVEIFLFTWTRGAAQGIARAKRDAVIFERDDLRDFRAVAV
jgi:hypothetical protein